MNETTLFLSKIMGFFFLIGGLSVLFNCKFYFKIFKNYNYENPGVFIFALSFVVIGMYIITKHFLWGSLPEIIITILGIIILFFGLLLAFIPKMIQKIIDEVFSMTTLRLECIIWIILGIYLVWIGNF